jgi:L-alanine-DL-glutamate epimerase-like enolase superfamily enzyme
MRITGVEAQCLRIPIKIPVSGADSSLGIMVIQVHTDEGITGVGIGRDYEQQATRELITRELGPFITGRDPLDIERIWLDASWEISASYKSAAGVVARAISGVDLALWDIKGKFLNLPVHRLLGGASETSIPVYITFGLAVLTDDELVQLARQVVAEGHDRMKYQAVAADRGQDISVDVRRLEALRDAVGEDVMILVDGNGKYDFYHARQLLKRLEPLNIGCFDHPVSMRDPRLMAELRRSTTIPLAARAYSGNLWDNRELIAGGAVDIMHTNVLDSGGYSGALKVAHMAEMFHLPMATGGAYHLHNSHIIGGVANGLMTEYHLGSSQTTDAVFVNPPKPIHGRFNLLQGPGLGLELNHNALEEYAIP